LAQLLVRNLEDDVKLKLKERARKHGRSTEEEVREILRAAVRDGLEPEYGLGSQIAAIFAGNGLDELIPEQRGQEARPAEFDD